jgi:hypothetical protein
MKRRRINFKFFQKNNIFKSPGVFTRDGDFNVVNTDLPFVASGTFNYTNFLNTHDDLNDFRYSQMMLAMAMGIPAERIRGFGEIE